MKVGIDLRFIKKDLYSSFITKLVYNLIKNKDNCFFTIYTNHYINDFKFKNCEQIIININNGTIKEQIKFYKILKKDKNNLMLFFNQFKPIFYKGEYITFLGSLKDIYYMNFSSYIEKYKYIYLLEKNLDNSQKIICLDENTKEELIERFDIKNEKINIIDGFFPDIENTIENKNDIKINIKTKYSIKNDFFIYSGGNSIEKNYEKLINVISKLKKDGLNIDLVFLGNEISKNINLRNIIIENRIEKNIFFLGEPCEIEKYHLYKESLATIFPSFYEPFPFKLNEPIKYKSHIISSDLKSIKNIFGDNIIYFSPISVNNIYENIKIFINNKNKVNYKKIVEKFNIENTVKQLIEIIK